MDIACFSYDPHRILGLHPLPDGQLVLRIFRPDAEEAFVRIEGKDYKLLPCKENGFFALTCPPSVVPKGYQIYYPNGLLTYDPYGFTPTWGELDSYLFSQGTHYKLYEVLGARVSLHQGVRGVKFAVWAPSASMVAVMGDFSHWDTRVFPMRCLGRSGVWELFLPGLQEGEKYKFCITTASGDILYKMDPMGYSNELRPATASIVFDVDTYPWQDQAWIQDREKRSLEKHPVAVYEVHLGSWKQELRNYQEIAKALACYVKEMGFTHVELLPIAEHPLDESWGYQVTGFYAVTSRFGTPRDFQAFVDILHAHGIGVILDWVPGHFPDDSFALARFDGTCLYEHEDPRQGHHPHWHTKIFNYGRHEVSAFLLANALFWLDKMHVDGLRVDAVASMLYLDYGRSEGEWIPNAYGGKENIEAIAFLKHLNAIVHERFPGVWMIAEESTSFIGVTHSLAVGGLGFDRKWNMGWMNDTLRYFSTDPFFRGYDHEALTFGLLYAFSEKFHLVLSHDEVVHGKRSLLAKMPGPDWQKFAGMRLLYSYMICQLGKKLLFMGGEIGQWSEWNCKEELDWFLLQYPLHQGLQACIRDLNHLYRQESALWQDDNPPCFSWVDFSDRQNSIISYLRKDDNLVLFCVHNFTPTYFPSYNIHLSLGHAIEEIFCSDQECYGGSGKGNPQRLTLHENAVSICIPPLATMIFHVLL